jgi:hypothetical protein
MSIFTLTSRPLAEQIQTIERGFPSTPLEMLATDLGAQKVENLLRAMMHGVPR